MAAGVTISCAKVELFTPMTVTATGSPTCIVAVAPASGLFSALHATYRAVAARGSVATLPASVPSFSTATLLPALICTWSDVAPAPGAAATTPRKTYVTGLFAGAAFACVGAAAAAAETPIAAPSTSTAAVVLIPRMVQPPVGSLPSIVRSGRALRPAARAAAGAPFQHSHGVRARVVAASGVSLVCGPARGVPAGDTVRRWT